jgi:serine/threonine-protein kinase
LERSGFGLPGRLDQHAYREHLAQQNRLRIAWVALESTVFYPAFSILDALVFPAWFTKFLFIRLTVTFLVIGYAVIAWRWPRHRLTMALVPVCCSIGQAGILLMIFATGGFDSSYWVGLLVMYAAYVGFTPHGAGVAAWFFGSTQAAYFLGSWAICGPPKSSATALQAMFFLGAAGACLALLAAFNDLNRRIAFVSQLRIAEQKVEIQRIRAERMRAIERAKPGRLCGRTLADRYHLSEVLGRGGAGEVYLAQDLKKAKQCAVKVLNPELADDEELITRFLREGKHAALVANEHVVHVFESGRDADAGPYLVMEYVVGEDLGTLFNRRGVLPVAELWPIVEQIAKVLEAAHAAGVVHRDLKPKNVLLATRDKAMFVKLIDFGISKLLVSQGETTLTAPVAIVGSIGYMAPEQAMGLSASVGPATDVFALGAIIYRGLTGRLAFPGDDLMNFCLKVCFQPFPPVESLSPDVHPDVTLALLLAMAKDPLDRLASPVQLMQLLERAGRGCLDEGSRRRARALYRSSRGEAAEVPTLSANVARAPASLLASTTVSERA